MTSTKHAMARMIGCVSFMLWVTVGGGDQANAQGPAELAKAQVVKHGKNGQIMGKDLTQRSCEPAAASASLQGFAPKFGGKADGVMSTTFPNPVSQNDVTRWLNKTAAEMEESVARNLDPAAQTEYEGIKTKTCGASVYCRISVAQQAIDFVLKKKAS